MHCISTALSENLDDVREEWERVKFSYEILRDPKARKSYDRNSSVAEVLEDPGGAMGRAVVGGALGGMGMVLGGAWKLGEMATKAVYETAVAEGEAPQTPGDRGPVTAAQPKIESSAATAVIGSVEESLTTSESPGAKEDIVPGRVAAAADRDAIKMITPQNNAATKKKRRKPTKGGKGFAKK